MEPVVDPPCALCGALERGATPRGPACAVCGWRVGDAPDPDVPRPRVDVVYYLRLGERVKIGTSRDPRGRLAALPGEELLALELGDRTRERARHLEFAADRLGTSEWFALSPAIRAHVTRLRGDDADPWWVYARAVAAALGGADASRLGDGSSGITEGDDMNWTTGFRGD